MDWIKQTSEDISDIVTQSNEKPVVVYKHSSRCSISAAALSRLERSWKKEDVGDIKFYFVDVINDRNVSKKVEQEFNIIHESPQIMIIYQGKSVYTTSHMNISYPELKNQLTKLTIKS